MANTTLSDTPAAIVSYLKASDEKDIEALVSTFAEDGVVTDEGRVHHGHIEIRRWREELTSAFVYTTELLGAESSSDNPDDYLVHVRIEGNFPGSTADLTFRFTLRDGKIGTLEIG